MNRVLKQGLIKTHDEDLGTRVVYYQHKKIQEQGLTKT
jgi:hypothetical protein